MPWPGITDFSEAVQNPRLCFRGTELEAATVSVNQRGMPLVFSGSFACVYPVSAGNRTFAVRCFTREVSDQQSRYGKLSNYLLNVLPPSFVRFEYVEHGISLGEDWYPIVKMEWVDGELLSRFVGSRLDQPDTIRRVAAQWRGGPVASLRGLRIAHNDLQHGNVLVQTDGSIRLVDYDGMFLPRFRGERSPELGHKNYQHPERSSAHYDENVDNFPSLVIYLSLLAIASDPGLWDFHDQDNLIFTRNDYADPRGSEVFRRLKASPDQPVARLAERLEGYCVLSVEKVPDLETVLQDIPPSAAVPPPSVSSPVAPRTPTRSTVSAATGSSYRQTLQARRPTPSPPAPPPARQRPITSQPVPAQTVQPARAEPTTFLQSCSHSFSALASRVATVWLKLLLGGMGAMFAGWMIHTDVFLSLVNLLLLITGIVAVLIFIGTKHPAALVVGVITLVVRFLHLLDWAVNAVWTWLIIAGLVAVIVGGAARIVTHRGIFGRSVVATVLLMAGFWSFVVVTGYDLSSSLETLLGAQSRPGLTPTPLPSVPPATSTPTLAPEPASVAASSQTSSITTEPVPPSTTPSATSTITDINGVEQGPPQSNRYGASERLDHAAADHQDNEEQEDQKRQSSRYGLSHCTPDIKKVGTRHDCGDYDDRAKVPHRCIAL